MKICNSCGNENGDNAKFCVECGEKLQDNPKFCPECGTELVNQPKFCPECGTKINNVVSNCKSPTMETKSSTSYSLGVYNAIVPGLTNYGGEVELCDAIKFGYLDKVKSLLNEGESLEDLSNYDLACVHNGEILNYIIKHGNFDFSDANFTTDILSSLENMYSCSLSNYMEDPNHKDFLENGDIFNSVQDIHNKYLGILKVLVDNGVDVNSYRVGWTILEYACFSKMDELICFLVEYCNADVNLDYSGDSSPLALATSAVTGPLKNDQIAVKTMRLLIKHGSDVNFHSGESTPLSNVMIDKNFELMEILYENGAVVTDYVKKLLDIYEGEERKKVKKILGL